MTETALATLTGAQQALAEAKTVPDLKNVRDMAGTLQAWARSRNMGIEAENQAAEVVLRAERAIGQVLPSLIVPYGARGGTLVTRVEGDVYVPDKSKSPETTSGMFLSELGITKDQSMRWQALARMPDDVFEALLASKHAEAERIAKVDFYRLARDADKVDPVAVRRVQALFADEPEPESLSAFAAFRQAAQALDLTQLPDDELCEFAEVMKPLLDTYNRERTRRG